MKLWLLWFLPMLALADTLSVSEKLAAEVSGPCELLIVEGGNHVVNNLWYRYRDQTADWMAAQLGVPKR